MNVQAHTALVTGGAVRLGKAIALELVRAGVQRVVVHYASSAGPARETAAELRALGAEAYTVQADLTDLEATRSLLPRAVQAAGPITLLVNSAALFLSGGLEATDEEMWERQVALNLRAPFFLCQAFARQLPPDREGCIVNLLDTRVYRPGEDHLAYRLTKAALADLTRNLAVGLAPRIRVNAVAPGAVLPPPGEGIEHLMGVVRERVPLQRPGSAEAVAASVRHLVESEFLTGVTIPVDGGEALV